jgi:adenylate cyclase
MYNSLTAGDRAMKRHLAAILAADIVDYSRMMAEDESGTLAALKSCVNEVIEPAVGQHTGRIFKTMGDGFLVEFASIVEAVTCAGTIQRGMAARNLRPVSSSCHSNLALSCSAVPAAGGARGELACRMRRTYPPWRKAVTSAASDSESACAVSATSTPVRMAIAAAPVATRMWAPFR